MCTSLPHARVCKTVKSNVAVWDIIEEIDVLLDYDPLFFFFISFDSFTVYITEEVTRTLFSYRRLAFLPLGSLRIYVSELGSSIYMQKLRICLKVNFTP